MTLYKFNSLYGNEYTIDAARREAGEISREAHDLCCWPLQAAPLRKKADAIFAEIASFELAEIQS